jgi:hypothetical protein
MVEHHRSLRRSWDLRGNETWFIPRDLSQVVPDRFNPNKNKYWKEVVDKSHKVVTFLDLCGHEKYLKTTIFGLVVQIHHNSNRLWYPTTR